MAHVAPGVTESSILYRADWYGLPSNIVSPHPVVRSVLGRLNTPGPLLAIGLGSATVAGSLWIASANRALSPEATKALYSFYFMVATIGTGVLAHDG